MVCLINTEDRKWYVYCSFFPVPPLPASADPKSAHCWQNSSIQPKQYRWSFGLPVHMACLPTMSLLLVTCFTPYTKCSFAIHKAFQVVNGGPLYSYTFTSRGVSGGDSNQLRAFASKTGPHFEGNDRKRPCPSIRCCNNKISFLWCQRFWKTRPCRSLFGWRGKWHHRWLVGVFFWRNKGAKHQGERGSLENPCLCMGWVLNQPTLLDIRFFNCKFCQAKRRFAFVVGGFEGNELPNWGFHSLELSRSLCRLCRHAQHEDRQFAKLPSTVIAWLSGITGCKNILLSLWLSRTPPSMY